MTQLHVEHFACALMWRVVVRRFGLFDQGASETEQDKTERDEAASLSVGLIAVSPEGRIWVLAIGGRNARVERRAQSRAALVVDRSCVSELFGRSEPALAVTPVVFAFPWFVKTC